MFHLVKSYTYNSSLGEKLCVDLIDAGLTGHCSQVKKVTSRTGQTHQFGVHAWHSAQFQNWHAPSFHTFGAAQWLQTLPSCFGESTPAYRPRATGLRMAMGIRNLKSNRFYFIKGSTFRPIVSLMGKKFYPLDLSL
jgi:hypothetical protein